MLKHKHRAEKWFCEASGAWSNCVTLAVAQQLCVCSWGARIRSDTLRIFPTTNIFRDLLTIPLCSRGRPCLAHLMTP
jgi:hypothetical protein